MGGHPEGKIFIPDWVVGVGHRFGAAGPCCCRGEMENDVVVRFRPCNTKTGKDKHNRHFSVSNAMMSTTNCVSLFCEKGFENNEVKSF